MTAPKFEIKEFMQLIKIDFDNLEDADEYLQLIMKLHNRIPHYSLYGYSPEELFKNPLYNEKLGLEAKVLYGFLLSRMRLSAQNNWIDDDGYIYLIYRRVDVQKKLNLSDKTAT